MEYKTRKASINDWANIEIEQGVPVTESHVNLYRWIDLAREMKAQRIRVIAPIPGSKSVGIELPNEQPAIVYSSQNISPSVADDPKQRKGYKIWLGGEVIYIFEDKDQGNVDEQGVYTYTGNYQLTLTPTLKGVYVQVLTSREDYAAKAHAEEILWQIKQGL